MLRRSRRSDSGMALIVSLGMLLIFSVMMVGLYFMVIGEQKLAVSNRVNTVAFYGAEAGLEKMSADLDSLSETTALTYSNITGLGGASNAPVIPNIQYVTYSLVPQTNPPNSTTLAETIGTVGGSGPLAGLQGIITPVTLTVVAQALGVAGTSPEVKLSRQVHSVAVPVFEFGVFSQTDISFWAGANYAFGGRVGSNGNVFLAEAGGSTLSLGDKITAAQDIIRTQLPNGVSVSGTFGGNVWVSEGAGGCPGALPLPGTPPANCRALGSAEGSVIGGPGSAYNNPPWQSLSLTTYNGYIRSAETGGKKLNLVLALGGSTSPIAMIQRGLTTDNSVVKKERFYTKASLRILLSDSKAALTSLPGAATNDANSPYPLDSTIYSSPYNLTAATSCLPPIAQSPGTSDSDYFSPSGTSLLSGGSVNGTSSHGYIKMEIQLASSPGTWQDVTKEILGLGLSRDVGTTCTNNSILHLEEIRPDKSLGSPTASDYIPINMFDAREGNVRDTTSGGITFNGIMNIVELDVHNLQNWFAGNIGTNGSLAINTNMPGNGYTVYYSDRRSNYDSSTDTHNTVVNNETGQYGNEDLINPASTSGTPNATLDAAEDVNGNTVLDTYGATPQYNYTPNSSYTAMFNALNSASPAAKATLGPQAFSLPTLTPTQGQKNGVLFFRRALRLVNGKLGNLPPLSSANCTYSSLSSNYGGFTLAAENPIYVLGDYNADTSLGSGNQFNDALSRCHVPAAVIGDAVTVLSNSWSDTWTSTSWTSSGDGQSFTNNLSGRAPSNTSYRMAVIAGKNVSFAHPSGWPVDLASTTGTDGGVHNFLRLLENWTSGTMLNYKGSLISFWYSVQATSIFKCCGGFFGGTVYNFPSRNDSFDTDFQNMATLPPGSPRFTDVNALSFGQSLLPYQ
jgi:hypothetical protein